MAVESTEDLAGAGGSDHFRAIRANITNDPASFAQMAGSRAAAPAISQDGSRIAFASKDDPLGTNADGNSEIFLFDGAKLTQVTRTSPGDIANRVSNGNFQPSISDDGRYLAFSSNRDLTGQNADGNLEIFIYDSIATTFRSKSRRLYGTLKTVAGRECRDSLFELNPSFCLDERTPTMKAALFCMTAPGRPTCRRF